MKIKENQKKSIFKSLSSSGISLIVLVITIIVIIILAEAIIITLTGNNPVKEANRARIESDVANMQAVFTNTLAKVMAQNQCIIEVEEGEINEVKSGVNKTTGQVIYTLKNTTNNSSTEGSIIFGTQKNNGTTYYTGRQLPIYELGETTWYVDKEGVISLQVGKEKYGNGTQVENPAKPVDPVEPDPPIPPEPEKAKVGEIVKEEAKEYIDADGDTAIIPIDFAIVPGKDDISNGLVISDAANDVSDTGNQFVWIPVKDISKFVREVGYYYGGVQTASNGTIDLEKCEEPYSGASISEKQEYTNMVNSAKEYKGFYIGRYEISDNGAGKAQSKKNKEPWVNIKFANSMTDLTGGIVEKARAMYPEEEAIKGKVVSTLIYGVAWDETIRFLKTNEKYKNIDVDSSKFGNYEGTYTGYKEEYSMNNIYDLAGNAWEWSMEAYVGKSADTTLGRILRGGVYYYDGDAYPISTRSSYTNILQSADVISGRVQLYIKQ